LRNTKDPKKIEEKKLTTGEKKIYKKRIWVENFFCYIKKNRRIQMIYDLYFSTYKSFLYLAMNLMIQNNM
jgi:hypothetical protein